MRLVPEGNLHTEVDTVKFGEPAPSAPVLQDAMRSGTAPAALNISSQVNHKHPLENRLKNWESNQHATRMEMYRRIFGAGEPIRREMELSMLETDFRPSIAGGPSNVHKNILLNREASIDWEDVYTDFSTNNCPDFHSEMEKKMQI